MEQSQEYRAPAIEVYTRKGVDLKAYEKELDKNLEEQGFTDRSGTRMPVIMFQTKNPAANAVITTFVNDDLRDEIHGTGRLVVATGPKDLVDRAIETIREISNKYGGSKETQTF